VAPDHPAFAGHFPGQPVWPGVLLLSLVMETVAADPGLSQRLGATPRIANAKFLAAVGPGAVLQVDLAAEGSGVAFAVAQGPTVVARGQLLPGLG
jgi:3-hydroxymyristoyl/3-hydroxydecanoyl-(acyl carrier protein) dehydratase